METTGRTRLTPRTPPRVQCPTQSATVKPFSPCACLYSRTVAPLCADGRQVPASPITLLSFFESAPPGSSKQIVRRAIGASNTGIMRSDAVNNVIFVHINSANIICKSPLWCLVHSSAPRRFHCLTQRTARAPGLKWNLMIQCGFHVYSPLSDIYTSSATGWA